MSEPPAAAPPVSDDEVLIRQAVKEDMATIVDMIQELADFEKMPEGPKLTARDLARDGFETMHPAFRCKVAEYRAGGVGPAAVVGYALYFPTYSSWEGRALQLEDLYVRAPMRRRGIGQRLFNAVAKETHMSRCQRLDFHVLDWNEARAFYENMGAVNLTQSERWCYYRLSGEALRQVASRGYGEE